jgi:bacterial/archaeal transporter family-2 protein
MAAIAAPTLLVVGALLALQAAANVQMSTTMRSPLGAATLQLGLAAALLLLAAVLAGSVVGVDALSAVPAWHLLGGLGSAVYITAGILLLPRLGAVVTVGSFITGQMLASLVLDTAGLLGVPAGPKGIATALGALAVLLGAGLIVRAQTRAAAVLTPAAAPAGVAHRPGRAAPTGTEPVGRRRWRVGWFAVGVLGGAVLPVQGATNALLRADLDLPLAVAVISFVVATAVTALVLAAAVWFARATPPQLGLLHSMPWWGWLGALVGAGYVTAVFLLLPQIGAAPTVALTVAGQQLAGLAVDQYGLLRLPRRPVSAARLLGVAVLLVGVGLLQLV